MAKKTVIAARNDPDGNIAAVRFRGNTTDTPLQTAIRMAERGEIEHVHVAHTPEGRAFLRTDADGQKGNNLDEIAKRTP